MSCIRPFPLVLLVLIVPCTTIADDAQPGDDKRADEWHVIEIDGKRVGYEHVVQRTIERDGRKLVVTEHDSQTTMKRFGQTLTMRTEMVTTELPNGDLVEFRNVTRNPPAAASRTSAVVKGRTLHIEEETAGRKKSRTLDLPAGTKSPSWGPGTEDDPLKPGDERTHRTFLPELNRIATITTRAVGREMVTLQDGTKRELLRVSTTNDVLPIDTVSFVDAKGEEVESRIDLLGTKMVVRTVPRKVALEKIAGGELDLAVATLVPVRKIENAHRTKRAVYRIHAENDDPARYIAKGGTQSIRRIDDETIEVTVTAATFGKPTRNEAGAAYLAASRFIQSEDDRVVRRATEAIEKAKEAPETTADTVRVLESFVRTAITEKNFSTAMASAAEVAERMEGDCTEHAVLLAGMLRARGVPSRIAVGLVYAPGRSAFAGHMWTEAFVDGHWVPIDGTLGRGGTAAAHLKMADSAFGDDDGHPIATFLPVLQSLGKLKIEVLETE